MNNQSPSSPPISAIETPKPLDRFWGIFATGLGTGYVPKGPGTAGSLLGPLLIWGLGTDGTTPVTTAVAGIIAFLIGVPVCNAGIRLFQRKDPPQVVFDEVAAFFWVFLLTPIHWTTAIGGFLLFRLFDIAKPWPIRRFERLPRGWGIMADDAIAGILAGVLLAIGWRLF
ncbi:MAG TPA: phosphatidylglycerophosphatase A [Planctomicrobium sp.]|nr:phosphatidylglycerophosphatase A [Planctomicrobium sp.]